MRKSNFALRLHPSLLEEARKAADQEGVALNQLINVAVAEKISVLRTQDYFQERASRANRADTLRILKRAGKDSPPRPDDELPQDWDKKAGRKRPAARTAGDGKSSKNGDKRVVK